MINLVDNICFLTKLNKYIHFNDVKKVYDINYIHFYKEDQKNLHFNSHFISIENKTYYEDYFVNDSIINIIKDSKSDDRMNFISIYKNNIYTRLNLNKAIIIYINTLSAGHELASMLYSIYIYNHYKLFDYDLVISDKIYELGNFLVSILYLFFDKSKLHFINNFTEVNIKETYIFINPSCKIKYSLKLLLNKLDEHLSDTDNICEHAKICLIKTITDKKINSKNRCFSNDYNIFFEKNGFKIIQPENLDVLQLYKLIKNCKVIVLSWGANSWINSIFINENNDFDKMKKEILEEKKLI